MKKTLLSAALVATLGALSFLPAASAATAPTNTGTIQFNGKVLADTCTVSINGSGTTVTLTPVMATSLATAGATAGATPFTLDLTNCDTNAAQATLSFASGSHNATDGNLTNTGTAGNVEVELLSGSTPINVTTANGGPVVQLSNGAGSTSMTAEYYATGAATPGLVSTSASVTFTYQ